MKTMFKIAFMLLISMGAIQSIDAQKISKEPETVEYFVSMTCMGCVQRITEHLKSIKGIIDVQADLSTKIVTITYQPRKITEASIEQEIRKLGYITQKVIR